MSKTLTKVLNDEYKGQWSSFPNATDTLEDYGNIPWRVDNPPSESDLKSKGVFETSVERQAAYDAQEYARSRATAYDSIGNQLDLLFHDMTAGKGSKTGEWYKAVAKVKADNPKG
jgi:hypothetical protein